MDDQQINLSSGKLFTAREDEYIKKYYIFRDKNSIRNIASTLKRSEKSIRHRITNLHINPIKSKKYSDCVMTNKQPSIESAYVLGAYLSDGWISKDCFEIHSIDKEYLEHIIFCLDQILENNFNHSIREYDKDLLNEDKKIKYTGNQYRIRIRSSDLCGWLINHTSSKQKISREFLESSEDILKHLLAGLMDGDGWISLTKRDEKYVSGYRIGLCGNEYLYGSVKFYASILNRLGIKYKKRISSDESIGFIIYDIDQKDFIKSKCFFKIHRKQERVNKLTALFENLNEHHGKSEKIKVCSEL